MTSEGQLLQGRYRLRSRLGEGGMGSVWLADDLLLKRQVALKALVRDDSAERDRQRARALREAWAMARVKHPSIVRVYDVLTEDGDPWIVMEHIDGRSLADIIRAGRLSERGIARIGLPVLEGLRAVHAAHVVHRDVKPANILVAGDGAIYLVDFGIARIAGDRPITHADMVIGTPEYIAPERITKGDAGPASDLWSLGVTLFYALEGYSPFRRAGDGAEMATALAIVRDPPGVPLRPGPLAAVILRLLDKDPERRATADDLAAVFEEILATPEPSSGGPPPVAPPSGAVTSSGAVTLSGALLGSGQVRGAGPSPSAGRDRGAGPSPSAGRDRGAGPSPSAGRQRGAEPAPPTRDGLAAIRAQVREAGPDAGADLLLTVPEEQAARVIAGCPTRVAGELLQAVAVRAPRTAGSILRMLTADGAGRTVDYVSPVTAATIFTGMRVPEVARILHHAESRTVAGVLTELRDEVSAELIKSMDVKVAAEILAYVAPATVAALLRTPASAGVNGKLLARLTPAFRAEVIRYLPGRS
jgi:tRNA A-37 threonylcarbamoyl transferase component Bud32